MTGRNQRQAIRDGLRCGTYSTPSGRFRLSPNRKHPSRIECVLCHVTGYGPVEPDVNTAAPWQLIHMLDHPYQCTACPQRFTTGGQQAIHLMRVHGCQ
ncbi:hypothetical protein SEA_PULCHRA_54 [Microbacterium phage Pulchra]|uniref:C2H2-type domain-containing protein n=1 Tax=Microbacterium phage Pulchra TaxID=2816469 RepID=A0A8A5LIM3_9CAUD|nr:hypothetical protein SEA_PULCHRA_54 [Microbacterium phage Pulchra]